MFLKTVQFLSTKWCHTIQSRNLYTAHIKMKNAYLSHQENAEHFQICLHFKNEDLGVDRQFNFSRQLSENVSDFLNRIINSFDKTLAKQKKYKKLKSDAPKHTPPEVTAELIVDGKVVSGEILCGYVIAGEGKMCLRILDTEYTVIVNAPWVTTLVLPQSIMAGCPVYPSKLELSFARKDECSFTWYKSHALTGDDTVWTKVGIGYLYTPVAADIGCWLKLTCIPVKGVRQGPSVDAISKFSVEAGPGFCPFQQRQIFTQYRLGGDSFRVVSYNILADLYADSDVARNELYPYCPAYALHIDYRKQLIVKEILGYNADIICLQEVDSKVFEQDLEPVLGSFGYAGVFHKKSGKASEGLACFYHAAKFSFVSSAGHYLSDELPSDPLYSDLWRAVESHGPLSDRLAARNTCVQQTVLDSTTDRRERLVIGNTHLYFHPDADHVRLLHAGMAIRRLEHTLAAVQNTTREVSVLMCGDFNSTPECGVYKLMTTQHVSEECIDWHSNTSEAVTGVSLSHSLPLASACGTPDFTNFTAGFQGCLDYIFYDRERLAVTQVVPLPSLEEVTFNTALPSVTFPSDHVAVVADIRWK